MSKPDKPKGGQPAGPESRDGSYYVPRLKEYRSITDLTPEDRESIADSVFGPSELKERDDLVRQLKKLAEEGRKRPVSSRTPSRWADPRTETRKRTIERREHSHG